MNFIDIDSQALYMRIAAVVRLIIDPSARNIAIPQQLRQHGINRPYDPDGEVLLLTKNAMGYLETIMQPAISIAIERRAVKLNVMLIPFIQEVTPKLASNGMLRYGNARELLTLPPLFRVGLSKDLRPLKITDRGDIVTYPVDRETGCLFLMRRLVSTHWFRPWGRKDWQLSSSQERRHEHSD
jgi:hypothetical protein